MTDIQINDLKSVGYSFFEDSESFLDDLSEEELSFTTGGAIPLGLFLIASSEGCVMFAATAVFAILQPDVD